MSPRVKLVALVIAGSSALACSLILDFEMETPRCWCGEEWQGQVSGAIAYNNFGLPSPIPQTDTIYSLCVSQLQHIALNEGDPMLANALAAGSIGQCELAGVALLAGSFDYTTCADQVPNVSHVGPCWEDDPNADCPLLDECRGKYDCDPEPVWEDYGDETGGVVDPEECVSL